MGITTVLHQQRIVSLGRRISFIAILAAIISLLTFSQLTYAASYSWYVPGVPPAGYLDARDAGENLLHVLNNNNDDGIVSDINATTPGDYCNVYKSGIQVMYPNGYNQSGYTGFDPSGSYNDWQEGDAGSNNVCQGRLGTWGFKVSGASNNNCTPGIVCGMHHFARLSNGQNNRPWSSSFGTTPAPALTFSVTVRPNTANGNTVGYICPLLQDVTTGNYVEHCFVEWQKGSGFPSVTEDTNGVTCASPSNWSVDTVWTSFTSNRSWATQRSGSSNTFQFGSPTSANFVASISAQNLRNVINKINQAPPQPNGCGRGLSTDVRNYALIGFEHGVEGGGYTLVGESVTNERFSTTTDALFGGDTMGPDTTIEDASGTYKTVMQGDGNLVTYRKSDNHVMWANGRYSPGARLVMQADGNLVEYSANNAVVWSSNTFGYSGAYMTVQGDGNLVVYQGAQAKWSSF